MRPGKVLVLGAGLAGLAAAVSLAGRGAKVELFEAAAFAGGRCRSYLDPVLDMTIDNGNHLILSGNRSAMSYLGTIGASHALLDMGERGPAFHDLGDGSTWTLWPNRGPLAWWIFARGRRVPGTHAGDYLRLLAPLLLPQGDRRIDEVLTCEGTLWDRLVEPFLLAALNTEPKGASAALAGAIVRETFARGGRAYRARLAHPSLGAAFIDPALAYLARKGAHLRLGQRVRALTLADRRVAAFRVGQEEVRIGGDTVVILATPPWISAELVPGLTVPDRFNAIVNAHFRTPAPPGAPPILGVIGGAAEWVFAFPDRLSVTVSGADAVVDDDRETLAKRLWNDVVAVHRLGPDLPPWQIVKERRATFAATPRQNARRPGATTRWRNLFLAGDWTDTGLPATIEGAIRSGHKAADLALNFADGS